MSIFNSIGKPIIVASHPRSGTHLTIDLLRRQFLECKSYKLPIQSSDHLFLTLEGLSNPVGNSMIEEKAIKILKKAQRPIIKTHDDPYLSHLNLELQHLKDWLRNNATLLYIIRDGRSVMCSLHLFMQSYDPYTRVSLSEFIRQDINGENRVKCWVNHVEKWLAYPNVYSLHLEDIISHTSTVLNELSLALKIQPLFKQPLLPSNTKNLWHGRWIRISSWDPESTAIIGYYKGKKVLNWKTSFTKDDHEFFNNEAGNLMERLGYTLK